MTPAETAQWMKSALGLGLRLTVVPMEGWSRDDAAWDGARPADLPPSPGIKTWECAMTYAATVFSEALPAIEVSRPKAAESSAAAAAAAAAASAAASAPEAEQQEDERRRRQQRLGRLAPRSSGPSDGGRPGPPDAEPSSLFPPPPPPPLDEDALSLRWAVALLARCLSLDNLVTLLTAALLERRLVFFHPDKGVVSACVLALVPLLRPFRWQCPMLPLLPRGGGGNGRSGGGNGGGGNGGGGKKKKKKGSANGDGGEKEEEEREEEEEEGEEEGQDSDDDSSLRWLEAPVPYALGLTRKTRPAADAARAAGAIRVNLYKDGLGGLSALACPAPGDASFSRAGTMPRIPRREALAAAAHRHHAALQRLRGRGDADANASTLASLSAADEAAADGLLFSIRSHLCSTLLEPVRAHALTEVDARGERVSVLLYDTYVASFAEASAAAAMGGGGGGGGGGGAGSGFIGSGSSNSAAVAAGERAFATALVETQLFGALVDEILGD